MDHALGDPSLRLERPLQSLVKPRKLQGLRDSILVSVAAYRDNTCHKTLQSAFENAADAGRLFIAVVEQRCNDNCTTATGWGRDRRFESSGPDIPCVRTFCALDAGTSLWCSRGHVKVLELTEDQAWGPSFARFLASQMWEGEDYFMQIDSHTTFRMGWDDMMISQITETRSFPRSIISNYPPRHTDTRWQSEENVGALCHIHFSDGIMRLNHTSRRRQGLAADQRFKVYVV